jgi:hypothetical protein
MGALVTILQLGQMLVSFIVPTVEAALKIKSHFELSPDYTVNVTNLSGDAISSDDATIANVNAWRASVGLPPLTFPTAGPATS